MEELEELYRTARGDVFAYATTLLRDQAAAEEVLLWSGLRSRRAWRERGL